MCEVTEVFHSTEFFGLRPLNTSICFILLMPDETINETTQLNDRS